MLSSNTSAVSGDTTYIEDVFSTYLYTGNGNSARSISNGIDLSTKGGMVWLKNRTNAYYNNLFDTARGVEKRLYSNTTDAQVTTSGSLTAFNTDGFSLGTASFGCNDSGNNIASWTFRKQPKFFDVVTAQSNAFGVVTFNHSLGSVPGCVMVKCVGASENWYVYHRSITNPNDNYLILNSTAATTNFGGAWTAMTSTQVTFEACQKFPNVTYVAYIFAHDAGGFGLTGTDNVISCGSYTGNGSASGIGVTLGYEPQLVFIKRTDSTGNWHIQDTMRGMSLGTDTALLLPNLSVAEYNNIGKYMAPTATGFQILNNDAGYNASGGSYIYIAIRRGPMKVPTDGTKVFSPVTRAGTSATATITSGFVADTVWATNRAGTTRKGYFDRLRGALLFLDSAETDGEISAAGSLTGFDNNTGVTVGNESGGWEVINGSGKNYVNWMFQRAPSFMDVVCFTGTSNAYLDRLNHNLTVAPELIITKKRSATEAWYVYSSSLNGGTNPQNYGLVLNTTAAVVNVNNLWGAITPNSTTFAFYADNGARYVSYLFATCAGVSKVGSYTGTGTTKQVDCGFAAGARFVLIKRTDTTGDWYVWDSARGIVSGNDPYLLLNSTAAETTTTDYIDTYSAGFELSSTAPAALNASGGTYIFLAIA